MTSINENSSTDMTTPSRRRPYYQDGRCLTHRRISHVRRGASNDPGGPHQRSSQVLVYRALTGARWAGRLTASALPGTVWSSLLSRVVEGRISGGDEALRAVAWSEFSLLHESKKIS